MTNEEAIKNLNTMFLAASEPEQYISIGSFEEVKETIKKAIKALEQEEKTGWIPVSERLPEEHKTIVGPDVFIDPSEEVLVQMKSGYMKVSRYWGSRERYRERPWIDLNYPTTDEVIAWMPLPERYKDGE